LDYFPTDVGKEHPLKSGAPAIIPTEVSTLGYVKGEGKRMRTVDVSAVPSAEIEKLRELDKFSYQASLPFSWWIKQTGIEFANTVPVIFDAPWNAAKSVYNLWAKGKTTKEVEAEREEQEEYYRELETSYAVLLQEKGMDKNRALYEAENIRIVKQENDKKPSYVGGPVFDPNILNWVRDIATATMGKKDYDSMMDRMKIDISIDEEAGNNPFVQFAYGLSQVTPFASDAIRWKGVGAQNLGNGLWSWVGSFTGLMVMLLITRSKFAPSKMAGYDKVLNTITSGLRKTLPKVSKISEASPLIRQGYKMVDLMIPQGIRGASAYVVTNYMRQSAHKFMVDEPWAEKDVQDLVRSSQTGFGMGFIGAGFLPQQQAAKALAMPVELIKWRAIEEASQMAYGTMIGLSDIKSQKGYIDGEDFGLALLQEVLEEVPELLTGGAMTLMGRSADAKLTVEQTRYLLDDALYKLTDYLRPEIKSDDVKIKKASRDVEQEYEKLKKEYEGEKVPFLAFAKRVKKMRNVVGQVKGDAELREKLKVRKDVYQRLVEDPELLSIAHQAHTIFHGLENMTKTDFQEALVSGQIKYNEKLAKRGTLQDPLSDFSTVSDNLWHEIQSIRKVAKFPKKSEYTKTKKLIIRDFPVPEKESPEAKLARATKDAETYRSTQESKREQADEITFKKRKLTKKEFDLFVRNWTTHVYGGAIKFDDLTVDQLSEMHTEMQMVKLQGEAWEYAEKMHWINPNDELSLDKVTDNFLHYTTGLTKLSSEFGRADLLGRLKDASPERRRIQLACQEDEANILAPLAKHHWARGYTVEKTIMENVHKYLGSKKKGEDAYTILKLQAEIHEKTGEMIPTETLKDVTSEYKVYWNSDKTDPVWIAKHESWNLGGEEWGGIADYFHIPHGKWIENYFPIWQQMISPSYKEAEMHAINSPNTILRKYGGGEGIPVSKWEAEKYPLDQTVVNTYINRMLNKKFYGPIVDEWKTRDAQEGGYSVKFKEDIMEYISDLDIKENKIKKGDIKGAEKLAQARQKRKGNPIEIEKTERIDKIPGTAQRVFNDFLLGLRGQPSETEKAIRGTMAKCLNKLPGVDIDARDAPRVADVMLSMLYMGGLGGRLSSALKNSFQGPMNNPPGMSSAWWAKGLFEIMTSPKARELVQKHGIFQTYGVPALRYGLQDKLSDVTKFSMSLFTWVDHFMNRGPIYLGARAQMDYYWKNWGVDGIAKIANRQPEGLRHHFIQTAKRMEMLDGKKPKRFQQDFDELKGLYGFLQQANSNWEYGKFGRPHFLGNTGGRMAFTFMSWPTWYFGTYMASLMKYDQPGFWQHIGKGLFLMYIMERYFSMNVKPWLLTGPMPTSPVGPIPQMGFLAAEYLMTWNYGIESWRTEVLNDLKMNAKVFLPGYYSFYDWMSLFREMQIKIPAFDSKTGMLKYKKNWRYGLTNLFGISTMWKELERAGDLMNRGCRVDAERISKRWGMLPYTKSDLNVKMGMNRMSGMGGMQQ